MSRSYSFSVPVLVVALASSLTSPSRGDVVSDLAGATIIEDFQFDDAIGTGLPGAANSAGTGHQFDSDADTSGVVTDGAGHLDTSGKANVDFGSNYVDIDLLVSGNGRVFGVMELTWDFDGNTLDTLENEEIRFSFIQFDPRSTFVVAEWEIQREDDNTVTLLGNGVGAGATDILPVVLNGGSLTQTSKFIGVLEADLSTSEYFVHYSNNGGTSFTTLGPGALDPTRDTIESLRLTLNNDLSDDSVRIDRFYLAVLEAGAIPEPGRAVLSLAGFLVMLTGRRRRR